MIATTAMYKPAFILFFFLFWSDELALISEFADAARILLLYKEITTGMDEAVDVNMRLHYEITARAQDAEGLTQA